MGMRVERAGTGPPGFSLLTGGDPVRFVSLTYGFYRRIVVSDDFSAPQPPAYGPVSYTHLDVYKRQYHYFQSLNDLVITGPTNTNVMDVRIFLVGAATVREVHDELGKDNGYTTTLKQMQLMMEKGLLLRAQRFGSHVYEASVPKEQTQRQIAGDLLKRAFGGSAKSLVMGALSAQPASREELAEIRGMLDTFAKEKGRSA